VVETVRETAGDVRRRAALTEAQCTAASYAPDPCSVSSDPLSTAVVGSSQVKVMLSSESSGRLKARRMASVNWR
jgi:hypothetical protein